MKKIGIAAIMFIGAMCLANAVGIYPIAEPEPITGIQETMGDIPKFNTTNEGEFFSFTNKYDQTSNPLCPCNLTLLPQQAIITPWGASMPTKTTFNGWGVGEHDGYPPANVSSTFSWTPNYCQSSPTAYSFNVSQYRQYIGFTPIEANIFMYHLTVNNVNRPPQITTNYNNLYYLPVGQSLTLGSQATDIDNTQCSESAYLGMSYQFSPYNLLAAAPSIDFSQSGSGESSVTIGPVTSDNIGTWDLKFTVNDGGTGNNNSSKNMTVKIYQPSSSPSCGPYNKRTRSYGYCK